MSTLSVGVVLATAFLAGAAGCNTSPAEALSGPWNSDGFNLLITPDSTAAWGNCSYGKIPGGLAPDGAGRFQATFDYTFYAGANGSKPVTTRIRLEARLKGNQLTVTLDPMTNAGPAIHILARGSGRPYLPCP